MNRNEPMCPGCLDEIYMVRHHRLFAPPDFCEPLNGHSAAGARRVRLTNWSVVNRRAPR